MIVNRSQKSEGVGARAAKRTLSGQISEKQKRREGGHGRRSPGFNREKKKCCTREHEAFLQCHGRVLMLFRAFACVTPKSR